MSYTSFHSMEGFPIWKFRNSTDKYSYMHIEYSFQLALPEEASHSTIISIQPRSTHQWKRPNSRSSSNKTRMRSNAYTNTHVEKWEGLVVSPVFWNVMRGRSASPFSHRKPFADDDNHETTTTTPTTMMLLTKTYTVSSNRSNRCCCLVAVWGSPPLLDPTTQDSILSFQIKKRARVDSGKCIRTISHGKPLMPGNDKARDGVENHNSKRFSGILWRWCIKEDKYYQSTWVIRNRLLKHFLFGSWSSAVALTLSETLRLHGSRFVVDLLK